MKRIHIQLADIATIDNLWLAVWKAARGKRHRPDVIRFTQNIEKSCYLLAQDIVQSTVPYGHYRQFYINDPKRRLIHAASFEDRVLHHAILNLVEPVFERKLVHSTYACRPEKGVHQAVKQVQKNVRRYLWYVKVDVSGYFPAIDHAILFKLLQRCFKGDDFLYLLWRIIDSYHVQPVKGLPIGSLTSQHFANYYLDGADRFLMEQLKVNAHVRYMDDILFWCDTKKQAKAYLKHLKDYLLEERKLQLKASSQINRSQQGVSYCGYRIKQGRILLSHRKRKRFQQLRNYWEKEYLKGNVSDLELQQNYDSVHAITLHADSKQWRKQNLHLHPSVVI